MRSLKLDDVWVAAAGDSIATAAVLDDVAVALGGRTIWQHASLSIPQGALFGLIGPNGTGKTTLLRLLLGQIRPSAGSVTVLGGPPRRGNSAIGYVPQRRTLEADLALRGRDLVAGGRQLRAGGKPGGKEVPRRR